MVIKLAEIEVGQNVVTGSVRHSVGSNVQGW